jgi:hypothetical protein
MDGVRKNQARAVGETPRFGRDSAALTEWVKGWCSIAKVSSMEDQAHGECCALDRWQASAYRSCAVLVGAGLLAMRLEEPPCHSDQEEKISV